MGKTNILLLSLYKLYLFSYKTLKMEQCFREYFLKNRVCLKKENFNIPVFFDFFIYEVLRVQNGVALFLEDHLERLKNSFYLKGIIENYDVLAIREDLRILISQNKSLNGNVKISVLKMQSELQILLYYIKHAYPSESMYEEGVKLKSLEIERIDPNAKILHKDIKQKVEKILADTTIYEVLLVKENGFLTEGSKSNIFFVKDDILFTTPDNAVLKGITRKYTLQVAKENKIEVRFEFIKLPELVQFNTAFLTGTSPKLLPVSQIDNVKFKNQSEVLHVLMTGYDKIINQYIQKNSYK